METVHREGLRGQLGFPHAWQYAAAICDYITGESPFYTPAFSFENLVNVRLRVVKSLQVSRTEPL